MFFYVFLLRWKTARPGGRDTGHEILMIDKETAGICFSKKRKCHRKIETLKCIYIINNIVFKQIRF